MEMLNRLERLITRGEHLIRRAEQGDEDAMTWAGFWNLTAISVVALLVVGCLLWWMA
jgi:hypothetical protein